MNVNVHTLPYAGTVPEFAESLPQMAYWELTSVNMHFCTLLESKVLTVYCNKKPLTATETNQRCAPCSAHSISTAVIMLVSTNENKFD